MDNCYRWEMIVGGSNIVEEFMTPLVPKENEFVRYNKKLYRIKRVVHELDRANITFFNLTVYVSLEDNYYNT